MKKLSFLLFVVLVTANSCKKNLDKVPLDLITDNAVWNDPTLIDAFLTMQYTLTTVMVNEAPTYIENYGSGSPVDGQWDIYQSEQGSGPCIVNEIADEGRGGWSIAGNAGGYKAGGLNVNGGFLEWWNYPYYVIRNLNEFIERVPSSPVDPAFAKKRIAEARFLRAFNYFNMVKRYGGVPLITQVQNLNDPQEILYPKRNTEKEIYDYVIAELDAIMEDLVPTAQFGRPNKWAALCLKSRASLYAGSIAKYGTVQLNGLVGIPASAADDYFRKADSSARAVMASGIYSLYNADADKVTNFKNIFLKKGNVEMIFGKQHNYVDALSGGGNTWSYDFVQRPKPHPWNIGMENAPYLEMAEEFEHVDGTSGTLNRTAIQQGLWSMADLWGQKDPRFYATLYTQETPWKGGFVDFHKGLIDANGTVLENEGDAYNGVAAWGNQNIGGNFFTGFGVIKLLQEDLDIGSSWSNSGTDYTVFRYGEVLLNLAEAAYERGNAPDALDAVNAIRTRAGIAPLLSITLDAIRHERKVELAFEGHRYWDLRRWRTAVTNLTRSFSGLRFILDYNTRKYRIEVLNDIDGANNPPKFFQQNYYFPITLGRTGANPNLIENPGY